MWCKFDNITKSLGKFELNLNFTIPLGSFVSVLGPSGCGKTSMLRLLAGLYTPDSGRILINDKDITHIPTQDRGFGMVFQDFALFPHLSVIDNIAYGLYAHGLKKSLAKERAHELAESFEISNLLDRSISNLSGGEKQRVALARTLAIEPELILFDEPLSSLDASLRKELRQELRELQRKLGFSAFMVTHDQEEAFALGDHIILMNAGRIEQYGEAIELYKKPETIFAANFIGEGNLLEIDSFQIHDKGIEVLSKIGSIFLPGQQVLAKKPRYLLIRPHALEIADDGEFEFELMDIVFKGPYYKIVLKPFTPGLGRFETYIDEPLKRGIKVRANINAKGLALIPADPQ